MNLIELSNQLKDVPDQFLLKEVKSPSGAYPAYMIVSELTRRQRMRDSVTKQMPETTVADDLVNEEERARLKKQQMSSLNAGLGSLPEVRESLAAQDAMGTTPIEMMMPPKRMAGGGIVSFAEGSDEPITLGSEVDLSLPSPSNSRKGYGAPFSSIGDFVQSITPGEPEWKRAERYKRAGIVYNPPPGFDKQGMKIPVEFSDPASREISKERPTSSKAESPESVAAKTTVSPAAFGGSQSDLISRFRALKEPTEDQMRDIKRRGSEEFKEQVPFRLGYMEDQMRESAEKLKARERSNINEALIQAGLGIMGSKSPRFLGGVAEGGLKAFDAYRQGLKDIQQGEKDLAQSRMEFAKSQMLYDKGMYDAGDVAQQRAIEKYKRGQESLNTESAIISRNVQNQIAIAKEGRESAMLPYDIEYKQALAEQAKSRSSGVSDADQKAAEQVATQAAMSKGVPGSPAYEAEFNRVYREAILRRSQGANFSGASQQVNRGSI